MGFTTIDGILRWETVPEALQAAGVDWYVYQERDNYGDNPLPSFQAYADTTTDLYRRANSYIPSTALLGEATAHAIKKDVLAGTLPAVSYIVGAGETSEHPTNTPGRGAQFIDQILEALTADMDVWAKTLLILNYDENGGQFDHVVPPLPPPGTHGEYLADSVTGAGGFLGPVGLGFRVPLILISPFTRGPLVCSDVFDHTSVIKLLERRFGIHCPNISDWRRATVGDLTSAINFAATPVLTVPDLPSGDKQAANAAAQASLPAPVLPSPQTMPHQETIPVRGRPSGPVTAAGQPAQVAVPGSATPAGSPAAPTDTTARTEPATLAATGLPGTTVVAAGALLAAALISLRLRNRIAAQEVPPDEQPAADLP